MDDQRLERLADGGTVADYFANESEIVKTPQLSRHQREMLVPCVVGGTLQQPAHCAEGYPLVGVAQRVEGETGLRQDPIGVCAKPSQQRRDARERSYPLVPVGRLLWRVLHVGSGAP